MKKYKMELSTIQNSFSGIYDVDLEDEKDVHKHILDNIYHGFNTGLLKVITKESSSGIEEIVYIPREKVEHIKVIKVRMPKIGEDFGD